MFYLFINRNNNMTIIGLDLSINSTGVCINKNNKYQYYIISSKLTRKQREFSHKYVSLIPYDKQNGGEDYARKEAIKTQNIFQIVQHIRTIIKKHKPDLVQIEGISYGSTGSSALVDLSGLNFMVRYMLEELHIPFNIISPSANKKAATGNGTAEKDIMIDAWKRMDKNIKDITEIKIDDLADSFFLSKYSLE